MADRSPPSQRRTLWSGLLLVGSALFALAAQPACKPPPKREMSGGDLELGRQAIQRYGCGGCHYVPGVEGAVGRTAQPLLGFGDRPDIAGAAANTPEALVLWLQNPQSIAPRAKMPKLGVNEKDARDIAAYLYSLKSE